MTILESLKIAIRALSSNRVRSFLTMLGVMIGVAAVVTMLAIGAGAQHQIAQHIQSLGSNVLMILPGEASDGAVRRASGSGHTLSEADIAAIKEEGRWIAAAAPSVRGSAQIIAGNKNWNTIVNGTTKDYFTIREWGLSTGRYFSDGDTKKAAKVALIGETVRDELFGEGAEAVGQQIRISNVPFKVLGVLAAKGPSGSGRNQDDIIFVPITTAKLRLFGAAHQVNRDSIAYALVKAASEGAMLAAEKEIAQILRQRHRAKPEDEDDFEITNPAAAMAAERAATKTLSWLLATLASVSLLVGGVSIMNIMLVSVTERRREIGLRLAVGARPSDLRIQFLIEAVTLCVSGGFVGVVIGALAAFSVTEILGWPVFISLESIAIALAFAGAVGIFFGYYPATRAARLNPIACLRSE